MHYLLLTELHHQSLLSHVGIVLNNRDGQLEYKIIHPDKIVARRGNAGMKLFHFGDINVSGPIYGHMHDAYHPLPQQLGEGALGSALQFIWSGIDPTNSIIRVHGIALDTYGMVARWHLAQKSDKSFMIEGPGASSNWHLEIENEHFNVSETVAGRSYNINCTDDVWKLGKQ